MRVVHELGDFLRRRRQANQIEGHSTNKHTPVSRRGDVQTSGFQSILDKSINRLPQSGRLMCGRDRWSGERLQRPPVVSCSLISGDFQRIESRAGPLGAAGNPRFDNGFFGDRKRMLGRHLIRLNPLPERALVRLTRYEGRGTALATLQEFVT